MARCPHCSGASILESPNIFFSQTISVDKQMGKIPKISHVCLIFFSGSHIFYENKQINIQERGKCGKLGIAMPALPGQKISTWVCILGNRFTAPGHYPDRDGVGPAVRFSANQEINRTRSSNFTLSGTWLHPFLFLTINNVASTA